ncbi:MAG: site-specific DNA-methyltransferase, partial [Gammaproteobacteria bacterium]|nr:site-specific DNA-methyltransferase [Gammaproteobacteria bacterium]
GRIRFNSLQPWPGELICADARYLEAAEEVRSPTVSDRRSDEEITAPKNDMAERRAGIFIGPEFGTVARADLVEAAREAAESGFDVLIACAFNFDAHASEFDKLGRIPVLKARMNADLHMAGDLKNTGKGNLFVIFGEPDIEIRNTEDDQLQVKLKGVDVFHPQSGDIRSSGPDDIACWFIDTDYDGESFFVRHAYFLGANDPYKSLRTSLKAEIDREAWDTLHSDLSRPFPKPATGRIAVKVINHLGDEAIKVFRV